MPTLNPAQWFYDALYRFTRPDWDTGLTPPEVETLMKGRRNGGRALDLGCGTGTTSIYLAQYGYDVVGVDFSSKAIEQAREGASGRRNGRLSDRRCNPTGLPA